MIRIIAVALAVATLACGSVGPTAPTDAIVLHLDSGTDCVYHAQGMDVVGSHGAVWSWAIRDGHLEPKAMDCKR